jgi:periplasmic protein TonB
MYQTMHLPTIRFGIAGSFAVVVTFLLFFLMQYLIENTDEITLKKSKSTIFIGFIRPIVDSPEINDINEIKPTEPHELPPDPIIKQLENLTASGPVIGITSNEKNFVPPNGELLTPSFNTELIPVAEAQPIYPRIAVTRNIEGYVIVEFTVTESGTTDAIQVLEAEPEDIFNKSAIKATTRSRYKPRIVDGKAVAVSGLRKKFTFDLED